jgi:nanoRNase/pAp phosphatase (c-di-AMP/oligoRNAs hydrolase)
VGETDSAAAARLDAIVDAFEGCESFLIQTHNNPDPDSIACAYALRYLVQRYTGHNAVIAFGGIIGRSENRAMVRELEIPLTPGSLLDYHAYDFTAVCDTQPGTNHTSFPEGFVPTVVIDHHPAREASTKCSVCIIEPQYGATSTLVAEMLLAKGIPIPTGLATALFFGIRTETLDLSRDTTEADVAVYRALESLVDRRALSRIESERVPRQYFSDLWRAIEGATLRGDTVTSELGRVRVPDMVPEMADFLLRADCTRWTCVSGEYKDTLYVSMRTVDEDMDAGEAMLAALPDEGSGGGHPSMAGGQIPLVGLEREERRAASRRFMRRFLEQVGAADVPPEPLIEPED